MASAAIEEPDFDGGTEEFLAMLADLRELDGAERHVALSNWARSPLWRSWGMVLDGWQGELHREAYGCLETDLAAETPGKAWALADPQVGRATIARLLGAEGWGELWYATFPFRYIWTQEDEPWIAGAVGCMPIGEARRALHWSHLDIREVVLWNPKTGQAHLLGDAVGATAIVMPDPCPDRLHVYADAGAWFAAWAQRRAGYRVMSIHQLPESADGHLPGALILGDPRKAVWPNHVAAELVADAGMTAPELRSIVMRSANLPKVLEGAS